MKRVLAALIISLAICGCGQNTEPSVEETAIVEEPTDATPKDLGVLTTEFKVGGDAILTTIRDITFYVNDPVQVEAFVTPVDAVLHVELISGTGEVLAEADVPAGEEVRLAGTATQGQPANVLRLTRPQATGNIAAFALRIRAF